MRAIGLFLGMTLTVLIFAQNSFAQEYSCPTGRIFVNQQLHGWIGVHEFSVNTETKQIYFNGTMHIPNENRPLEFTADITNELATDFVVVYEAKTKASDNVRVTFSTATEITINQYKFVTNCTLK